jgi:hypothetical protein
MSDVLTFSVEYGNACEILERPIIWGIRVRYRLWASRTRRPSIART